MNSISCASLGYQFGDLQSYNTDTLASSDTSVENPSSRVSQSHLSLNMDPMERYLSIEKQRQTYMGPVHFDLPSRSVSQSPHVRGGAYPVHRPQSPIGSMSTSYSSSLFTPAPVIGLDNCPALYRPANLRVQSEDGLYCRDPHRDTSSHLPIAAATTHNQAMPTSSQGLRPLPRQRRNTYVSQLDLLRRDLYSSTDTST